MDLIAVHVGAGTHNPRIEQLYFDLCSKACDAGIEAFECECSPIEVVSRVVQILEDSELTNAGYGSNICWDGTVECDASIMSGWDMRWSGVGAMNGVKNPILVATELHKSQEEKKLCGLVSPILLCGRGATDWASSRGYKTDSILTSDKSLNKYNSYKRKYERHEAVSNGDSFKERRLDTIGAIAVSRDGQTASAVSSGGVALKVPGRIGQAAIFGAGCWAQDGIATTTTGTGEQLIKTNFARSLNDCLTDIPEDKNLYTVAEDAFTSKFSNSRLLKDIEPNCRLAGFLSAVHDSSSSRLELLCGHNTPSMIYSFRSTKSRKSCNFFSKYNNDEHGKDVKVQCHLI